MKITVRFPLLTVANIFVTKRLVHRSDTAQKRKNRKETSRPFVVARVERMDCVLVHRIRTRSVHDEQYSILTSTNMQCVLVTRELQRHHGAHGNSSVIWSVMSSAGLFHIFSLPVATTRSTTWTARPSPRRHCTPSTTSRTFTVDKQP